MRPLIALLTDFGTRDPYVAQVKGVIFSTNNSSEMVMRLIRPSCLIRKG